jgi:hypothetical protein
LCSRCTNFDILCGTSAPNVDRNAVNIHVRLPETGSDSQVLHTSGTTTEHFTELV